MAMPQTFVGAPDEELNAIGRSVRGQDGRAMTGPSQEVRPEFGTMNIARLSGHQGLTGCAPFTGRHGKRVPMLWVSEGFVTREIAVPGRAAIFSIRGHRSPRHPGEALPGGHAGRRSVGAQRLPLP